ncbi:glutaredoxin family protein [Thalassobellus sediminis]|uniref:glutaredoxin family protein n=1 Tax=Thalassobellus sediminis TaxID=3367753 RepID=UPI00378A5A84
MKAIKLYGTDRCHKTKYYKAFLEAKKVEYQFFDVEGNKKSAEELRNLYETKELHFPTITIGEKRLRNPSEKDLNKWLGKLI